MNKYLLTGGLLCCTQAAWAISNVESERPMFPDEGWSGTASLCADGKTGNKQKQLVDAAGKLVYRDGSDIYMALISREYGTDTYERNADNSYAHLRWTHLLGEKWGLETFAQWQQNEFDNLTSRTLVGGGGRYLVAHEENRYSLALGLGGFREYETENLVTYKEHKDLWRVNSYYSAKYQVNEQLSFVNTTYFQPKVGEWGDNRVLFDVAAEIKLSTHVRLSLTYRLTHDTRPVRNLDVDPPIINHETNTAYKTTLAFDF